MGVSVVVVVVDRLSVVTVLQGVQYPGLAAPSTTTTTTGPPAQTQHQCYTTATTRQY